jgi:hypothetical protein
MFFLRGNVEVKRILALKECVALSPVSRHRATVALADRKTIAIRSHGQQYKITPTDKAIRFIIADVHTLTDMKKPPPSQPYSPSPPSPLCVTHHPVSVKLTVVVGDHQSTSFLI